MSRCAQRYIVSTLLLSRCFCMKLLVFDVEGTLFQTLIRLPGTDIDSTIWQGIAHRLGESAIREEVATHGRWSRGEYRNYLEWMKDTILIHQKYGLTGAMFRQSHWSTRSHPVRTNSNKRWLSRTRRAGTARLPYSPCLRCLRVFF
jgi:hypothetical protein